MLLKSTGNKITKIKISNKEVIVSFENESIKISKEAYLNCHLYQGKELTKKEINQILDFSKLSSLLEYSMSLLRKGHYTENKMKEKLSKKGATNDEAKKVIRFLKSNDLIDDRAFIEDHIGWSTERNIGKYKIIKELTNLGIDENTINKIKFPLSLEKQKAVNNIESLEKKYSSLSFENKKKHIYTSLKLLGFEQDVVLYALNKLPSKNEEDETTKLIKDHDKAVIRLSKKYSGKELDCKVYNYLKNKGYSYNDIQAVMEVKEYDD